VKDSIYGNVGEFLAAIMFGMGNTPPLGRALTSLMKKVWSSTRDVYGRAMLQWLEKVEAGETFQLSDLAKELGVTAQTFSQRYWAKGWDVFFKALKSNPRLLLEIAEAARQVGLDWDPSDPIPFAADDPMKAIRTPRPQVKSAGHIIMDSVVGRWFSKHL